MKSEELELFEQLRLGNETAFKIIYKANYGSFNNWILKYCKDHYGIKITEEEALEIFHNTLIIFYQKIRSGKLEVLTCSIKTYLTGVGINLIKQFIDREKRRIKVKDIEHAIPLMVEEEIVMVDISKLNGILKEVGNDCIHLLKLVFWDNLKYKEIAKILGDKTDGGTRKAKYDCLKELNKKVREKGLSIDFFFSEKILNKQEYTEVNNHIE